MRLLQARRGGARIDPGSVVVRVLVAGVVAVLLVGGLVAALLSVVSEQQTLTHRIEHSSRILRIEHVSERHVVDLETGLRGYVATGDRAFLAPYWAARAALPAQLAALDRLVRDDPAQEREAQAIQTLIDGYVAGFARPLLARPHPPRGAALVATILAGKVRVDALRARFSRFDRQELATQSALEVSERHSERRLQEVGVTLIALILVGLCALVWWVAQTVAVPVRRSSRALGRLAAGERELRLEERGASELRRLARAFNDAAAQLTERERELQYLADHDPGTGLLNRSRFTRELELVVGQPSGGGLLVLDLNGFKQVNDRFGHAAGDELITRVADLLVQNVRPGDIVARIGGDEFAVVMPAADESASLAAAQRLAEAVRASGTVVQGQQSATVTASLGIATFDAGGRLTPDELLVEADIALYDAKADPREGIALYDRAAGRRDVLTERHARLDRLHAAVEGDGFVLHAQPIVGIAGAHVPHYELLLRMRAEDGALIAPGTFLADAERLDLMGRIDRWVLRRAIALLHEHHRIGLPMSLSVNLSGRTMNDLSLADDLAAMLADREITEGTLIIEVTETAAIENIDRARDLARELRRLGCKFALDDFGSGFASFYYLKHLDFDYLKIDGEFIRQITSSSTDQLVVRAVVDIARALHTSTVAEFVEDEATVKMLLDLGVDYAQGYHLGRPGPLEQHLVGLAPDARGFARPRSAAAIVRE